MKFVIGTAAAVLLLAGCGGSKPPNAGPPVTVPPVTTTVTATPTPAATTASAPATLTREQAAARYLALGKPINAVFAEPRCAAAEDFFVNGESWPPDGHPEYGERPDKVLRSCHQRLVPLFRTSIRAFQTTAWPVDAHADVADLVSQDQAFLYCLGKTSKATSTSEMYKAMQCFPEDDGSADRVRARFGLPIRTP